MSSRTRSRGIKTAAGIHTVHIPRSRGRRSQPFVVVVPEHPSLTREALGFLGRLLWRFRAALAPTFLALLAWPLTALLHALAWWSGLLLAPVAAAPLLWLGIMQRRHPARTSVLAWRSGLTVLTTAALAWVALAAGFGPLAGPMPLIWLLAWLTAQTAWLIVRSR
ncbi:hypothetical protein ACFYMX_07550 [Streptomyces griseofuscus]|uniref:hypothetical protein n=1 Tax=Streptomyces griseofuscus TaxID=146922 RepID=UPI00368C08F6